jgi:hypothetical protein
MSAEDVLYLSSLESERFEPVRTCLVVRRIVFDTGKDALVVLLEPGVPGVDFGRGDDVSTFVLTTRFEGASIAPIEEFPCFVFIALPKPGWTTDSDLVTSDDLEVVGWGELYRTAADATSCSIE